jgi:hypothetical protein
MSGFDDDVTPADRRLRDRAQRIETPRARTPVIWVVGLAVIVLGALGLLISITLLQDATDHGDEGALAAIAATSVLVSAIQVASGIGVLVGAGWARHAARIVCVVNLLSGLFGLLNGASPVTVLGILLNIVLLVALSGEKVREWCGD